MYQGQSSRVKGDWLLLPASFLTRMQSFRRSIRSSIRRRRSTTRTTDDRKKIAQSMNIEAGIQDKKSPRKPREAGPGFRGRATSEPVHSTMDANMALSEEGQVPPELAGYVTNLAFAETHVFSGQFRIELSLVVCHLRPGAIDPLDYSW